MKNFFLIFLLPLFLLNCNNPKVIDDLGDASFELVNQDNIPVTFPDDFKGKYVVIGFIYTHCPDVCSLISQNLVNIQKRMEYPDDVHFVAATFDPERDTPSVLSNYGEAFGVGKNFTFLTGDSTQVFALMDSVRVRSQISFEPETDADKKLYFINHSDKIMVLDKKSRVIFEYAGSLPMIPNLVIEDLNKIR